MSDRARRPPIPTLGRVSGRTFLAVGAVVGALGWGSTALLTARPMLAGGRAPALVAAVVWALLIAVMVGVGLFGSPDRVRFSRPFLAWGPANGLATLATVGALLGWLPDATYWLAWALAGGVGYLGTWAAVRAAGGHGGLWLSAAGCEVGVVIAGVIAGGPWPFLLLGVAHALPLVLETSGLAHRYGPWVGHLPLAVVAGLLAVLLSV